MAKFAKPYKGAVSGSPFPSDFKPGDECPAELETAAALAGVLEGQTEPAKTEPAKTEPAKMPGVK